MVTPPFNPEPLPEPEETALTRSAKIAAAKAFLQTELMAGPRARRDLVNKARAMGHAERTLQLASQLLGVEKTRTYAEHGGQAGAVWALSDKPAS